MYEEREHARAHQNNVGEAFEEELSSGLRQMGLRVHPFGVQGVFPGGIFRAAAKAHYPELAHLPDFLVTDAKASRLIAIEAKGHKVPAGPHHHACNLGTMYGLGRFQEWSSITVLIAFSDWRCIQYLDMHKQMRVRNTPEILERSSLSNGDRTPFGDIWCSDCDPLDEMLGRFFS